MTHVGRNSEITLNISGQRCRESLVPFRTPAWEKGWQGKPPVSKRGGFVSWSRTLWALPLRLFRALGRDQVLSRDSDGSPPLIGLHSGCSCCFPLLVLVKVLTSPQISESGKFLRRTAWQKESISTNVCLVFPYTWSIA